MPTITPAASLDYALENVKTVAEELFAIDPRIRSVGVTWSGDTHAYHVVRNSDLPMKFGRGPRMPQVAKGVPLVYTDSPGEVESMLLLPDALKRKLTVVPEVQRHRPLVYGLEIQNFDDDTRQGVVAQGYTFVGTLGCFVLRHGNAPAILSNNHVVAGENRGLNGSERWNFPRHVSSTTHKAWQPKSRFSRIEGSRKIDSLIGIESNAPCRRTHLREKYSNHRAMARNREQNAIQYEPTPANPH